MILHRKMSNLSLVNLSGNVIPLFGTKCPVEVDDRVSINISITLCMHLESGMRYEIEEEETTLTLNDVWLVSECSAYSAEVTWRLCSDTTVEVSHVLHCVDRFSPGKESFSVVADL